MAGFSTTILSPSVCLPLSILARAHSHIPQPTQLTRRTGPATALYLNGVAAMTSAQVTVALAAQANTLRTFEKEPLVAATPANAGTNYLVMDRIGAAYSSQVPPRVGQRD